MYTSRLDYPQMPNPYRYQEFGPPPFVLAPPPQPPLAPFYQGMPFGKAAVAPSSASPWEIYYVQPTSEVGGPWPTHEKDWSTNLFGCLNDVDTCIMTCCCPSITSGRVAEIVSEGKTSRVEGMIIYMILVPSCVYSCHYRGKMRKRFMLKGDLCRDCVAHTLCSWCALCQEHRELYKLGFDASIGWYENIERQRQAVAVFRVTPPEVEQGMKR